MAIGRRMQEGGHLTSHRSQQLVRAQRNPFSTRRRSHGLAAQRGSMWREMYYLTHSKRFMEMKIERLQRKKNHLPWVMQRYKIKEGDSCRASNPIHLSSKNRSQQSHTLAQQTQRDLIPLKLVDSDLCRANQMLYF